MLYFPGFQGKTRPSSQKKDTIIPDNPSPRIWKKLVSTWIYSFWTFGARDNGTILSWCQAIFFAPRQPRTTQVNSGLESLFFFFFIGGNPKKIGLKELNKNSFRIQDLWNLWVLWISSNAWKHVKKYMKAVTANPERLGHGLGFMFSKTG